MASSKDPKAILHKLEDFCVTEVAWRYDMKNKYLLKDTQVYVSVKEKDEMKWQELVPLEEYFSVFTQSHLDNLEKHCGRDKTYKVSAAGQRQGLSKKLITTLINRCGCFKKRERQDDEGVEERPAKRGAGTPAGVAVHPPSAPVSDIQNSRLAYSSSHPNVPAPSADADLFVDTFPFNKSSAAYAFSAGPFAAYYSSAEPAPSYLLRHL